jgi:hypothetical protein
VLYRIPIYPLSIPATDNLGEWASAARFRRFEEFFVSTRRHANKRSETEMVLVAISVDDD